MPAKDEHLGPTVLMAFNPHLDEILDKRIDKSQTSRKTRHATFPGQTETSEATQYHLCQTETTSNLPLEQVSVITNSTAWPKCYAHPSRRLPVELLREIFEIVVFTSKNRLLAAVSLSSVCIMWREIALGAPRLWNTIQITPFIGSDEFWNCVILRLKVLPLKLHLRCPEETNPSLLENSQFKNCLQKLKLEVHAADAIFPLIEALFDEPYTDLRDLCFIIGDIDNANYSTDDRIFYQDVLANFPNLIRFRLIT